MEGEFKTKVKEYFMKNYCNKCKSFSPDYEDCGFDEYNGFHCNADDMLYIDFLRLEDGIDEMITFCGNGVEISTDKVNHTCQIYCPYIDYSIVIVDNRAGKATIKQEKVV